MPLLIDTVRTIASFVLVLGVLVFVHEMGHYLAARWRGVHVEAFSIGFGRPLARWTDSHGTEWRVCWLPLGGYVKLHGQEQPQTVTPEVRESWIAGHTFHEKSVASRAIVVAAGPIANFLLAIVLFSFLFAVNGETGEPVVGSVQPNSAAAAAGFQADDRILSIDGQQIPTFAALTKIVLSHPGVPLHLTIERDGRVQTIDATPAAQDDDNGGKVGLLGIVAATHPVSLPTAIGDGVVHTYDLAAQTLIGLGQIVTGQRGTAGLGGPIRIAELSGQVAQHGASNLISFIALLSVSIGLLNLFPIPILDGGHLLFYAAEAIRGRPLPPRALDFGLRAGLAVIACIFIFVTLNDLGRFGLFRWVAGLIG